MTIEITYADLDKRLKAANIGDMRTYIKRYPKMNFKLEEAATITVKGGQGKFRRVPFISGDFTLCDLYLGKKGEIIFCFGYKDATDGWTVELGFKQAFDVLDGRFAIMAFELSKGSIMDEILEESERRNLDKAAEVYGSEFGSW